jgi:ribonuclease Z
MPFDVILLGTGSPLYSPVRCGAGNVVVAGDTAVLVDCGWGAARRLIASGVPLGNVKHAFFTHMHSDHITDLPDFLIMRWTMSGAAQPLHVYGPEGTREMVEGFRAGLEPDVRYRIAHHGEKLPRAGMDVVVHEVPATPDVTAVANIGPLAVGAFEVDHYPVVPALGFRVESGGAAVVFSGDTKRTDNLVRAAKGADTLVSEALHLGLMQGRVQMLRGMNNERVAKMLEEACEYHTPTLEVAEMARDAGVRRLVISHLIPPIPDDGPPVEQFIAGMADVFAGELVVGRDLQRITVGA